MFQVEKHENGGLTFPVDSVVPAEKPLWAEPLRAHVAKRFRRKVLLLPQPEKAVVNVLQDYFVSRGNRTSVSPENNHTVDRCHPLVEAVATAFSQHRPLVLSPDCIWLTIEQGFAHHIAENAETLRHRLVRHQGSQELIAEVPDLHLASFQSAIAGFSSQIRERTDPVLHETLLCDFSTTTPAIRTASEVVQMDCYSSYFSYAMLCVCGIPKITLTGSVDDWRRIRARLEVLDTFELGWWITCLRPILDEFIRTAEGHPSPGFWQGIYKPKKSYGEDVITGWIADLFPYLHEAPHRSRNPILKCVRENWAVPIEEGIRTGRPSIFEPGSEKGIARKDFPPGLASVPLKVTLPGSATSELDLVAGFFGVEQDPADLALSPVINWSVTERAPARPIRV